VGHPGGRYRKPLPYVVVGALAILGLVEALALVNQVVVLLADGTTVHSILKGWSC
jgi:hypothetical protein